MPLNESSFILNTSKLNTLENGRIAKNTLLLYTRMFVMILISLYTSRIVLQKLGVNDYGIYNLVGGLVTSFSVISDSLSTACSRFLNFEMGRCNTQKLRSIISTSFNIQLYLSVLVVVLVEIVGVWFLNNKLTIPHTRLHAANWILQLSMLIYILRLIMVPLNAMIISHEKMGVYAYFSIIEAILQLLILYLLSITTYDRLITYGVLMLGVTFIVFVFYLVYCLKHFEECCYSPRIQSQLMKEMFGFASWNFIGATSQVLRNQGIDVVVNVFFGVAMNAARGIASQVNTALTKFSSSFMSAINPQITKSYAQQNFGRFKSLVYKGSRISFYLLLFLSVPLLCEMDMILKIWLDIVPNEAVIFSRLQIILALLMSLSSTLITAMLSTGNIRRYQISVGILSVLSFPIAWCVLKLGAPVYTTYIVIIVFEFICLFVRLKNLQRLTGLQVYDYFKTVLMNILEVSTLSFISPIICVLCLPESISRMFLTISVSFVGTIIAIYLVGLNKQEKEFIASQINVFFKRR